MGKVNAYGQGGAGGVFGIGIIGFSIASGIQGDVSVSGKGGASFASGEFSAVQITIFGIAGQFVFEQPPHQNYSSFDVALGLGFDLGIGPGWGGFFGVGDNFTLPHGFPLNLIFPNDFTWLNYPSGNGFGTYGNFTGVLGSVPGAGPMVGGGFTLTDFPQEYDNGSWRQPSIQESLRYAGVPSRSTTWEYGFPADHPMQEPQKDALR